MASSRPNTRTLMSPAQPGGLPLSETTIAELLQQRGYRTAAVGKWHLGIGEKGEHLPLNHGFESFFGMPVTNVQACGGKNMDSEGRSLVGFYLSRTAHIWLSMLATLVVALAIRRKKTAISVIVVLFVVVALSFGAGFLYFSTLTLVAPQSCLLYRDNEIIEQPVRLDDLTVRNTAEAVKFLKKSAHEPFFLYMSYVKVHTALFTTEAFRGKSRGGAYGDNMEELDWSIGRIMQELKDLGIANNTLVFFSSDNGPFRERRGESGSCGAVANAKGESVPLRGAKGQTWECGIRVPGIIWWNGAKGNRTVSDISSTMDLFATVADLTGGIPAESVLDGQSLLRHLENRRVAERRSLLHYCGDEVAAVRVGKYKVHFTTAQWEDNESQSCPGQTICGCHARKHRVPVVFDMVKDPSERTPVKPLSDEHAKAVGRALAMLERHRRTVDAVANQLDPLPRPWLFPCCNAPESALERYQRIFSGSCSCRDEEWSDVKSPGEAERILRGHRAAGADDEL